MSVSAPFSDIERMLKDCAPGSTWRLTNHSRKVNYDKKTYKSLPKHKDIEVGHIRKMIRHLGINIECARKYLPV